MKSSEGMLTTNYMKNFISRKYLTKKYDMEYFPDAKINHPHIYLEDPHALVRFAGYLKKNIWTNAKSKVFFRGQTKDNGTMIPSLFRGSICSSHLKIRESAYNELIFRLPKTFTAERFQKDSACALLQHYGIRTPLLDLVDNLYIAIWFAAKERVANPGKPIEYIDSKKEFGWVHFIRTKLRDGSELKCFDLREEQSSLSLRLHVQHGISATRSEGTNWSLDNRCLNDFVVASVRFPINQKWKLKGPLFDTEYMFPSIYYDDTYKRLKANESFKNLIRAITEKYRLSENELGKIDDYIE